MIMTRAPFRISFAGGGSDLESFYRTGCPGAVVSTSIDKYMYIMIHPYFDNKIRVKYSKTEDVDRIDDLEHPLVRECLRLLRIERGVEIASIADVPAGTGIGSSSAFTVALLQALYGHRGRFVSKERLAREACEVEIRRVGEPIGKQDQYASSYGGLNHIRFRPDGSVAVEPIVCSRHARDRLERSLLMFYVGNVREAGSILREQKANMALPAKHENVRQMAALADRLREAIGRGRVEQVGEIMHAGWCLKRELATGITNPVLDSYYERALAAGAVGGKLLGAGGGGFFLFYCDPKHQPKLRAALDLRELRFRFDSEGATVLHVSE